MPEQWFLKVDGIAGESTSERHRGAIDVVSWAWGVEGGATSTGAGAAAGKARFGDLQVVTRISKASPLLLKACATGARIKSVSMHGVKVTGAGGEQEFLTYTLTDATVRVVQHSDGASNTPAEQLSFGFRAVKVEYRPQTATGKPGAAVTFSFDVAAAK